MTTENEQGKNTQEACIEEMMQFRVLSAKSIEALQAEVSALMLQDWMPHGNLVAVPDLLGQVTFYQAMLGRVPPDQIAWPADEEDEMEPF